MAGLGRGGGREGMLGFLDVMQPGGGVGRYVRVERTPNFSQALVLGRHLFARYNESNRHLLMPSAQGFHVDAGGETCFDEAASESSAR